MRPFFSKTPYEDPEIYARSSPITFIKNAKTPTLIIVGDSDGECPPPVPRPRQKTRRAVRIRPEALPAPPEKPGGLVRDNSRRRSLPVPKGAFNAEAAQD